MGELDGFGEVQADLVRRVGVGAEADGDAELRSEVDDARAGVDFAAFLPEAGGVEFDHQSAAFGGLQESREQGRAVLLGVKGEFLAQVGVADDVKEAGFSGQS